MEQNTEQAEIEREEREKRGLEEQLRRERLFYE